MSDFLLPPATSNSNFDNVGDGGGGGNCLKIERSEIISSDQHLKANFTLFTACPEITGITVEELLLWFGNQTPVVVSVCHQTCYSGG